MVENNWQSFQKPQGNIPSSNETSIREEEKSEAKQAKWGDFKTPTTYQGPVSELDEESTLGYIGRNLSQYASRGIEQVAGRYGNTEKFLKDALVSFPSAGGVLGTAINELVGKENWERLIRGREGRQQMLPTSENIKEAIGKSTGGYTLPKTKGESMVNEKIEDVAALFSRGSRGSMRDIAIRGSIPVLSGIGGDVVEYVGFGKDAATKTKLGLWTTFALLEGVNGNRHAARLMNDARNGIPNTVIADVPRLQQRLRRVANSNMLLHVDPRSASARQALNGIEQDLRNGQTSVRSLMNTYDGINALKRSQDMFSLTRTDRGFATRALNSVRDVVREEILDSAHAYPNAIQSWESGLGAWAAIHQSNHITNIVQDIARGPYGKAISGPALSLFGIGGGYGAFSAPAIAATGAAAAPILYKSAQIAQRVLGNDTLREYYINAIRAASQQNQQAFINNFNKLNKGLEKEDKKGSKKKSTYSGNKQKNP